MAAKSNKKTQSPKDLQSPKDPQPRPQSPKEPQPQPQSPEDPQPKPEPAATKNAAQDDAPQESGPEPEPTAPETDPLAKSRERTERFRVLRARMESSSKENMAAVREEARRLASAPGQLAKLSRKRDAAAMELERADMEAAGEDYERRRAWDWTAEESEAWDRKLRRTEARRDNAGFSDYTAEANKTYKRQVRTAIMTGGGGGGGDSARERYEKERMAAIERAAAAGGLDIVETEDGELIAVDRDGSFYSTADSTAFASGAAGGKPDKAAIDRLVADLQKAEDARLKKRRERMAAGDEGDVTYINEKNKQFNLKLARFYNKYTTEVRESFERGTMI